LSTVYGIVKQCGGEVMVDSEEGQGTRFDIYFPAVSGDAALEKRARGQVHRSEGGETILVVEDDSNVRDLVSRLLGGLGYAVVVASNGQEAVGILGKHDVLLHLMLTDVVMPGMSGPELAACARTMRPGLPVLFISGYPDVSVANRGVEVDPDCFVQKPFTAETLSWKIRQMLERL